MNLQINSMRKIIIKEIFFFVLLDNMYPQYQLNFRLFYNFQQQINNNLGKFQQCFQCNFLSPKCLVTPTCYNTDTFISTCNLTRIFSQAKMLPLHYEDYYGLSFLVILGRWVNLDKFEHFGTCLGKFLSIRQLGQCFVFQSIFG